MPASHSKTIIAFFPGTGYDSDEKAAGYISQETLMGLPPKPESSPPRQRNLDLGFDTLTNTFNNSQVRYLYDGCHQRGGGLFSYGIEQPAEHLFKELKKQSAKEDQNITLILSAHSRGCLTALLLAKMINQDPELKEKVEVMLDLRDPVPGNLKITSEMDLIGLMSSAGQLSDLRNCTNIKAAHITVQDKGILDLAFDVLIPHFAQETALEGAFQFYR